MGRKTNSNLSPDWAKKNIASLRHQLEQSGEWPESADQLLSNLIQPDQSFLVEDNHQMLALVINDALEGIDITESYPAFYRQMLADARLRSAFLDALALLAPDTAGKSAPLPQKPSLDLSFLKTADFPRPVVKQSSSNKWRADWNLLIGQLNRRFFQSPKPVYRSVQSTLEDDSITLLRSDFQIGSQQLEVLLEAFRSVDTPEQLKISLWVTETTSEQTPNVSVNLQWGRFQETIVPDQYGRAQFPPLALETILDDAGQTIQSDLLLSLETI